MTPGELLRGAGARSDRYARMTAEDAVELGAVFWQVARRQATDAAGALGVRLGRSPRRARRSPRDRS
jgi:hypothetical protein